MKRRVPYILISLGLAANLCVWVLDPLVISRRVLGRFADWRPDYRKPPAAPAGMGILEAMAKITPARVARRIRDLSAWPSRGVGYAGNREACRYIQREFSRIGLKDIRTDTFRVAVPVDRGGIARVDGEDEGIPLACLWPNHVRTPTVPEGGVSGRLVFGGDGSFSALNGQPLAGSIVLLEFDCDRNYVNPMMLGARAVIFLDTGRVNRGQAELKSLPVPAAIPRFWAEGEAGRRLRALAKAGASVRVTGRMSWENAETWNVFGWIPGSDDPMPVRPGERPVRWRDRTVAVQAYYDAISVVPGRAPGADAASGMAALLEVAEALRLHPPRYSVLILATSGHFHGLAGINDFLYRHSRKGGPFLQRIPPGDRIDFGLMIGLDLSSGDDRVALFSQGTFYSGWQTGRTDFYRKNTLKYFADRFAEHRDRLFPGDPAEVHVVDALAPPNREWWNFMSTPLAFDTEAALYHGMTAVTFATPHDSRDRVDTPADTAGCVIPANVASQTRTLVGLVSEACGDPAFFPEARYEFKDYAGDLGGAVYEFDRRVNPFVPKRGIPGAVVVYGPADSRTGVRTMTAALTDELGRFRFRSVRSPAHAWTRSVMLSAYQLNGDGEVAMAPDLGEDGDRTYPLQVRMTSEEMETMVVLFPCRALSLFEVFDSRTLFALDSQTLLGTDDGPLRSYGTTHPGGAASLDWSGGAVLAGSPARVTTASVAFAPPRERVKVLMSTGLSGVRYLLTNAPDDLLLNPVLPAGVTDAVSVRSRGTGYPADEGVIVFPAYRGARDMWVLNDLRLKLLARFGVKNGRVEGLHREAREALLSARKALGALEYDRFIGESRRAWGLEARAYPDVRGTADDTVRGVAFYLGLLLPFSFFAERLLVGSADVRRRLGGVAILFLSGFLILKWVHPAFRLASTPYIIFLAFVILALAFGVLALLAGKFNEVLRTLRAGGREMPRADVGRLTAVGAAAALGISNLRKRPLRTGLTSITLILLTFTALTFTSVVTSLKFYRIPRDNRPLYQGMLVRDRGWRGLQTSALEVLSSAFGMSANVLPRSWYTPGVRSGQAFFDVEAAGPPARRTFANGLLGLTWREPEITGLNRCLASGRWFEEGERDACLLPDTMADLLGIHLDQAGNPRVGLFGRSFRVVGILDSARMRGVKDLDDERLTPVDAVTEGDRMNEVQSADPETLAREPLSTFAHLAPENVLVLPHQTVMDLGGALQSVAVSGFLDRDLLPQVEGFMARVALTAFVGFGERVEVFSSIGTTSLKGLGGLAIPVAIAALIVLNTMLGAVYERVSEIGVYASLGLAPSHISALFLAEAGVFATVGAVVGYLVGQVTVMALSSTGRLGGLTLNYSSLSAVTSTLVVMGTVMLSAIYPSRKAAAMAVPDVTRRWVFPPPDGDHWRFDFPFTVGGAEVAGAYAYLAEVFESYGEGSTGGFLTDRVRLGQRGREGHVVEMMTWLAPYDLGISQEFTLRARSTGLFGIYGIAVHIHRISGDVASWQRLNRGFLSTLRKHFLVWRTLSPEVKAGFAARAEGASPSA